MIRAEKSETVLKKHVAAIHCSTGLTLIQRKMSNALLFHAFPNLMTEEEHTITISQICKIIGYNSYNYELIKSSLRALMTTLIEWNVTNEDLQSEDWSASTIISGVRLADNHCTYSYSPHIKRLLSNPSIYGQINLIIQAQFKSSYGLALYENCVRYKGLSSTKWMDYLVFRKLMGVEEGKYHIFRDFKKRVLDRAVLEVNTYSDLSVEYELKTEKRNVKLIRFLIQQKEKKEKS
ncbi:MAG: replication initiation protein [Gammaproteobacteria bacterium]|nr:replication initiation protein [Gammaproteobacteria bacterium]